MVIDMKKIITIILILILALFLISCSNETRETNQIQSNSPTVTPIESQAINSPSLSSAPVSSSKTKTTSQTHSVGSSQTKAVTQTQTPTPTTKSSSAPSKGLSAAYIITVQHNIDVYKTQVSRDQTALDQAKAKLTNIKNEKNVRLYSAATGKFEWVADPTAVANAQKAVTNAENTLQDDQKELKYWENIADANGITYTK